MARKIPADLIAVINKYLEGTATPDDLELVSHWYSSFNDTEVEVPADSLDMKEQIDARLRSRLKSVTEGPPIREIDLYSRRRPIWLQTAAAAAIVCIISTGAYFFLQRSDDQPLVKQDKPVKEKIQSLENKIILTLQDGSKISMTDVASGKVIVQAGFTITKTGPGQLTYASPNTPGVKQASPATNTLETPSGGQVQVTYPDGSKVSINASSSFSFPVAFSSKQFNTKLDGEAYFEVTPDKSRKFMVRSGMQITEVLGTRFNINAYRDEPSINTTLLEGSIRITDLSRNNSQLIKPGQQSVFNKTLQISDVEAEDAIAWTEGYFHFNNADIKVVMRELERWYGIKVRYEGKLTSQKFDGSIDKKLTLDQVLGLLGKSQVHFKMHGKEVVVML